MQFVFCTLSNMHSKFHFFKILPTCGKVNIEILKKFHYYSQNSLLDIVIIATELFLNIGNQFTKSENNCFNTQVLQFRAHYGCSLEQYYEILKMI